MKTFVRKLLTALFLLTFGTEETALFPHPPAVAAESGNCVICGRKPGQSPHGKAGRDIAAGLRAAR